MIIKYSKCASVFAYVYVSAPCVCTMPTRSEKMSDPLELVLSCPVGAEDQTWVLCKSGNDNLSSLWSGKYFYCHTLGLLFVVDTFFLSISLVSVMSELPQTCSCSTCH